MEKMQENIQKPDAEEVTKPLASSSCKRKSGRSFVKKADSQPKPVSKSPDQVEPDVHPLPDSKPQLCLSLSPCTPSKGFSPIMSQFFQMPDGAPTFDLNFKPDFVPMPAIDSATTGSTHANADPHQGGILAVQTTMHEQPI